MNRWIVRALPVLAVLLLAAGWLAWRAKTGPAAGAAAPGLSSVANRPQQTLDLAPQDLQRAVLTELRRGVDVSGSLKAVNRAWVKAKVAGEVRRLNVREGELVRAGQVLAEIDTTEYALRVQQASQQAEATRAQLDIANRQLSNNQALVQQGFISATALDTAVANAAAARANQQAALAALALAEKARADATLRAPIGGTVAQRLVQPGERVPVDGRLLEIVDLGVLELEAAIPPDDVTLLRPGALATLQVEGNPAPVAARVARINPSAAPGARTVTAYLSVAATPGLRDGLFARAWVALEQRQALVLPLSAVRLDAAQPYAIVVQQGVARHRPLQLGSRGRTADGTEVVEVRAGLADGDTVLAASSGLVADGTPLNLPRTATTTTAGPAAAAAPASAARRALP